MARQYARIIIDISHEKVDRPFSYRIPDRLIGSIRIGSRVRIPFGFGNRERTGYVVGLSETAGYEEDKIKEISGLVEGSVSAESQLIELAWWMKERYGSTMNQALKTVLPVKQKVKGAEKKYVRCQLSEEELKEALKEAEQKHYRARVRLFETFLSVPILPYETAIRQLNLTSASLKSLEKKGILTVETENAYRNPAAGFSSEQTQPEIPELNFQQRQIVEDFCARYERGERGISLIHGITGSGKTEVYMGLIEYMRTLGKEVIVLIPEIALTYQTVMRFYKRFGTQVSFINSRLSRENATTSLNGQKRRKFRL